MFLTCMVLLADFAQFIRSPLNISDQALVYEIDPGVSLRYVANDLHKRDIIDSPLYWQLLARLQGKACKIKAGQYRLQHPSTPSELLDQFVAGKTVQFSLTILEGWTYAQIFEAVSSHPQIKKTLHGDDSIMARLGRPEVEPEGWFYPDTYFFPKGTTDFDFLLRSYDVMNTRLQVEWEARVQGIPLKTPYEALILASIVEKETANPEERPLIAAVFLSRLRKGMLLQTDPTVIYGLGQNYRGDLRYRDLRRDTPYNTYLHKGLTPTPIASPSGDAIHAVLNPADTQALYFVAKGDGNHHFSETYAEHKKAVIKYQLNGNKKRYKSHAKR